ncbi:hypothetical protein C8R47DRAFT_1111398 [Mycena vitilis]|nr:hypothetical protein C8R47DRAFT_1111398 [Mycena vitilis]
MPHLAAFTLVVLQAVVCIIILSIPADREALDADGSIPSIHILPPIEVLVHAGASIWIVCSTYCCLFHEIVEDHIVISTGTWLNVQCLLFRTQIITMAVTLPNVLVSIFSYALISVATDHASLACQGRANDRFRKHCVEISRQVLGGFCSCLLALAFGRAGVEIWSGGSAEPGQPAPQGTKACAGGASADIAQDTGIPPHSGISCLCEMLTDESFSACSFAG